jgi:DNA modification methylase
MKSGSQTATAPVLGLREHLTHKANLKHTRYGWLRLTPAYSVHLVVGLLDSLQPAPQRVLDPFCGTGTTALVCAERGIQADTTDINPFLLWLARCKTRSYGAAELAQFEAVSCQAVEVFNVTATEIHWTPPLHQIEKWWGASTLQLLSRLLARIHELSSGVPDKVVDLLKLAFCRTLIERANVSFGHQSMSFKSAANAQAAEIEVRQSWETACQQLVQAARSEIALEPQVLHGDARQLATLLPHNYYDCVITSPPYPNRMSYIRELRPYMYWLGYLKDGREAGELDWQAIGGTWGCATSNVGRWTPDAVRLIPYAEFENLLAGIAVNSPLLARYVHKYFYDMSVHIEQLWQVVKAGGTVRYIIGNSKFYETLLPVEQIFAALFRAAGFEQVAVKIIRKRTSKKELFEYVVSACKP